MITTRASFQILTQARDVGVFDEDTETLEFVNGLLERLRKRARETRKPAAAHSRDELTARERSIVEFIARAADRTRRSPESWE